MAKPKVKVEKPESVIEVTDEESMSDMSESKEVLNRFAIFHLLLSQLRAPLRKVNDLASHFCQRLRRRVELVAQHRRALLQIAELPRDLVRNVRR